jgi:hypothetical protein
MRERGYLDAQDMAAAFNMLRANDLIWSFVVSNYLLNSREPLFGNVLAYRLLLRQLVEDPLLILLVGEVDLGRGRVLRRHIDIQLQNLDVLFGFDAGLDLVRCGVRRRDCRHRLGSCQAGQYQCGAEHVCCKEPDLPPVRVQADMP